MLFQVYFLSLLLEERGKGDLAAVAEHCREKLIRRHPHVFGEREAETAGDVVRNWQEIKRERRAGRRDPFGHLPETLPSTIYAKKVLKRARSAGHDWDGARATTPASVCSPRCRRRSEAGADPELSLRAAADRYSEQAERGK